MKIGDTVKLKPGREIPGVLNRFTVIKTYDIDIERVGPRIERPYPGCYNRVVTADTITYVICRRHDKPSTNNDLHVRLEHLE